MCRAFVSFEVFGDFLLKLNCLHRSRENWLVEVVRSVYDLDNINLVKIEGSIHSEFELEGHCFDSMTGAPPRRPANNSWKNDHPTVVDTIVMANLGYY